MDRPSKLTAAKDAVAEFVHDGVPEVHHMINRRTFMSSSSTIAAAACAPGAAVQQEAMVPEGASAWEREWGSL